jgi:hypothetical protein
LKRKNKQKEIFEEEGKRVVVPPDVSEQRKKALKQTGDGTTQGW